MDFFVFTQLNPVTELSIFFKDLDAYLAESNIDKVKNVYNKEQKAYWKQGVDLLKAEIKGRIKARGVALNEIDLARLQLVVKTHVYKILAAETLDFIGLVSMVANKNLRNPDEWNNFFFKENRTTKDIVKFASNLQFKEEKVPVKEQEAESDG